MRILWYFILLTFIAFIFFREDDGMHVNTTSNHVVTEPVTVDVQSKFKKSDLDSSVLGALLNTSNPKLKQSDPIRIAAAFNCSKKTCKQIGSCEEACYKLIQCGQKIRDRDGDGIPCENLCSSKC